jgi:hypothetical protein
MASQACVTREVVKYIRDFRSRIGEVVAMTEYSDESRALAEVIKAEAALSELCGVLSGGHDESQAAH